MQESDKIEIRSEEVQEIIGQTPSWLLRSGITLLFVILILLLLGSWFFRYPDSIQARIVVISDNPPASLVARANGKIDQLKVIDGQIVAPGDVLAVLENSANYKDIFELKRELESRSAFFNTLNPGLYRPMRSDYQLGEVQEEYSKLLRLTVDYVTFMKLNYYPRKIASLNSQINANKAYYNRMSGQREDVGSDFALSSDQFKRDSLLFKRGVLSKAEYEKSRGVLLQKRYQYNTVRASMAELQRDMIQQKQLSVDAEKDFAEQTNKVKLELKEAYNNLKSRLAWWEKTYAFISPVEGRITFTTVWNKNQQVKSGDMVFTIVPLHKTKALGRISLPIMRAGKVKPGQEVNIQFDNYPYMEYGMIKGNVESISLVPSNDYYIAEVSLPERLVTNYKVEIPFGQEMQGNAEIITEDLRLLQRIVNPVRSLLSRHAKL
ncbi:MAG: HlyD family efflux transporter periplasmic adaptor subunit [Bacteroidota bacterium]|nr:HlyD family efflux transporter periplasmic adaptor subunit [Bacteroidota bacterium]